MEKNIEVSLLLDFYGDLLKEGGRQATDLYYNEDFSLSEIADRMGITRQGVRDSIKRCEKQLYEYESKLGMLSRFRQTERGLDEIIRLARQLGESAAGADAAETAKKITDAAEALKQQ